MKKPLWLSDKILTAVKERDRLKKELKKGRIQRMSFNEGGIRVCGIAVLGYFWCGVAVILISKYGIAVFRVQAVCGEFKFYVAVVGEKMLSQ